MINKVKLYFRSLSAAKLESLLFFLVILFLPTQLARHFWPDFSTIFSIRTDYFSPTIYFWDLLVIALLVIFFYQRKLFTRTPLFVFLFFCLNQLGSLFGANNVGAGLVRLESYFICGLFGVYIASQTFSFINRPLYVGLVGGMAFSSILAILQVFNGGTIGLWFLGERNFSLDTLSIATFDWYGQVFLRAYATFPHPNVLAAFLLIGSSLLLWLRKKDQFIDRYRVEFLVQLISAVGLLLTFSRVALVFYGLVFSYVLKERLKILLIIFLFLLPFLYVRFHSAFNFDQLSFIRREELALASFQMIEERPLFGVGLNNFINELAYGNLVSGESRFLQPVHTIFLLSLAETGIVGLVGLLGLFGVPIKKLVLQRDLILLFIWISIIGLGFFDHYFLTLAQGQRLLFLVWGISMLDYESERNVKKSKRTNFLAVKR